MPTIQISSLEQSTTPSLSDFTILSDGINQINPPFSYVPFDNAYKITLQTLKDNIFTGKTVTITGGTGVQITGSHPNFGITITGSTTTGGTISGDYLPLSGGTVTGSVTIQSGLTVNDDATIRNAYIGNIPAFGTNYMSFSHISRNGNGDYSLLSDNVGITYLNAKKASTLNFRIDNIDKMILDSDGKVGIGTTSPSFLLDVNGDSRIGGNLTATTISATTYYNLPSTTGTYLPLSGGTVTGGTIFQSGLTATTISAATYSNLPVTLYTGNGSIGANRTVNLRSFTFSLSSSTQPNAIVISGGSVGIGTSSPTYKLDVVGNSRFTYSSNNPTLTLSGNNTGYSNILLENSNSGNTSGFVIRFLNDLGGSNYVGQIAANSTTHTQGSNRFIIESIYSGSSLELGSRGSNVDINTVSPGSGNTRLRVFNNGNVAIGTNPSDDGYKLDVSGTSRFTGNLTTNITDTQIPYSSNGILTGSNKLYWDNTNSYLVNKGYYFLEYPLSSGGGLVSRDQGTSNLLMQMGFNAQGQYGGTLGSTSGSQFFVYNFQEALGGVNNYYWGFNNTGDNFWGSSNTKYSVRIQQPRTGSVPLSIQGQVAQSANLLTITTTSASTVGDVMTVFPSGNIGIGQTTDATYKLDVNGTARIMSGLTVSAVTDPVKFIGVQTGSDTSVLTVDAIGVVHTTPISSFVSGTIYKSSSNTFQTTSGTSVFYSSAISSSNFSDGDLLKINVAVTMSTTSVNSVDTTYWINTGATISGATQISLYTGALGFRYYPSNRFYWKLGSLFYGRGFATTTQNSDSNSNTPIGTVTIPSTFYIIVQVSTTGTDRACLASFQVVKS